MQGVRVYLSGPSRGLPGHNFGAFESAAAGLRVRGLIVHSPAEVCLRHGFHPDRDELETFARLSDITAENYQAMIEADVIAFLPGAVEAPADTAGDFILAEAYGIDVLPLCEVWNLATAAA